MELQRKESKEFLDDLTTRDQRMMFAVMTITLTSDTKEQLDSDTEALFSLDVNTFASSPRSSINRWTGLILPYPTA